jgi:hypothetical protein
LAISHHNQRIRTSIPHINHHKKHSLKGLPTDPMDNNRVPNADNSAHSHSINNNNRGLRSPQKIPIRSLPKPNIITHFNKARARCLAIAKPSVQDSETYAEGWN